MEDAHVAVPDLEGRMSGIGMFAVFDGHGGGEVAKFCAKHLPVKAKQGNPEDLSSLLTNLFEETDDMLRLPEYLQELPELRTKRGSMTSTDSDSDVSPTSPGILTALQASIQSEMSELRERGGTLSQENASQLMMKMMLLRRLEAQQGIEGPPMPPSADNVGCTAVVALLSKSAVTVANAGDSRAVLCRNGQAIALSEDHKPNDDIERRRIEAAGSQVHELPGGGGKVQYRVNGNLNLSRALGDLEYKKRSDLLASQQAICSTPDLRSETLTEADEFIVLACDGVWDVYSNQEVVDFVAEKINQNMSVKEICEALVDSCLSHDPKETQGIGADNITCVIVRFKW